MLGTQQGQLACLLLCAFVMVLLAAVLWVALGDNADGDVENADRSWHAAVCVCCEKWRAAPERERERGKDS